MVVGIGRADFVKVSTYIVCIVDVPSLQSGIELLNIQSDSIATSFSIRTSE